MVGHTASDTVTTETGTVKRPGGTPLYARRSLDALGVDCTVVTRGGFGSRLVHHPGGVEQWVESVAEPFTAAEVLAALDGCRWLLLGGQTAGDFPPETIAALAAAGHDLCLDGQGLCRGTEPGPVRLRPFDPAAVRGVAILKLNRAEGEAAAGSFDPEALRRLGVPEVAVTLGAEGALGIGPDGEWRIPPTGAGIYPDPTGAGDTWTAAYVTRRAQGAEPRQAAMDAAAHTDHLYL